MLKCKLRKICYDKNIRSIAELQRITGISRPTLYKMYDDKDIDTIKAESFDTICIKLNLKTIDELLEFVDEEKVED